MTSLDRLPAMPPAEPPGHAEAVENLRAGNAFTCVLSDDPDERAILLQSVIDAAADMETRFVRVCNPLRAPLTIERVFLQAVGPDAEVRLERNGEALTRILAARFADETRLIVAIEQAETLDSDALQALHDMAPSFPTVVPRVQLLFCGPKSFAATLAPPKPAPAPPAPAINRALADEITSAVALPVGRRRGRAPIVLALLLAAVAAAGALAWHREPALLRRLGLPVPAPAGLPPAANAAPSPAPAPATLAPAPSAVTAPALLPAAIAPVPAPDETASLRRDFDRFLAERPDAARLTQARKDELFDEFLQRRRARAASP